MDAEVFGILKFISIQLGIGLGILLAIWWQIVCARLNK